MSDLWFTLRFGIDSLICIQEKVSSIFVFILVCAGAGQFDYIESLHLLGHSVSTAMLKDTVKCMLFASHHICNKTSNVRIT